MNAPRSKRVEVNGWVVLDKPVGMTSTHAVSRLKRVFNAKKAGHAGTLDPLASGILPVAFGEATKSVPFVQAGEKAYRFTVKWGVETDSDDSDGSPTRVSDLRPSRADIEAALPAFIGEIMQQPPAYSAIKVNGERAYDMARDGEIVDLPARPVTIHSLVLVAATADEAVIEAQCGKGTYVRAIARDLGRMLGCLGRRGRLHARCRGRPDRGALRGGGPRRRGAAAPRAIADPARSRRPGGGHGLRGLRRRSRRLRRGGAGRAGAQSRVQPADLSVGLAFRLLSCISRATIRGERPAWTACS